MPKITKRGGPTNAASYPVGLLPAAGADVEGEIPARPRPRAPKPDWVAYASAVGVDVDGLSKRQIIALAGG